MNVGHVAVLQHIQLKSDRRFCKKEMWLTWRHPVYFNVSMVRYLISTVLNLQTQSVYWTTAFGKWFSNSVRQFNLADVCRLRWNSTACQNVLPLPSNILWTRIFIIIFLWVCNRSHVPFPVLIPYVEGLFSWLQKQ